MLLRATRSGGIKCWVLGFRLARINGSHHIFTHPEIKELVNLQNVGGQAKPYQIKQFLRLVERYDLRMEDDD